MEDAHAANMSHDKLNGPSTARPYARLERGRLDGRMIDNFALGLSHGLILLAAWRLLRRPDLDEDGKGA
jgi:hypothetical protein